MQKLKGTHFFTADEHYFHKNSIKYCNRPFKDVEEMNREIIDRHNSVVTADDITIHIGDFGLGSASKIKRLIGELNGRHVFLEGSHDRWLKGAKQIWESRIDGDPVICCHYCMRVWAKSHYNSWHLYGHSHGTLPSIGKSMDVGVDTNDYYPYSFDDIKRIMKDKPDNPNLVRK